MTSRSSRALAGLRSVAILGAVAAGLLLAACGASGTSTNSTASAEKTREQQFLSFAKCLREHGINVSTPTGGGPFRIAGGGSPQTFEAAQNACRKFAPADRLKLTPQQRIEREEAVRKFAKCMREHGVNLQIQTRAGGAGIGVRIRRGEGGPNPESPAFEAAQKACQALLPKPPGGFRRGGPFGGPGGGSGTSSNGGSGGGPRLGVQAGG
jgi:hypothetical protein